MTLHQRSYGKDRGEGICQLPASPEMKRMALKAERFHSTVRRTFEEYWFAVIESKTGVGCLSG